MERSSGAWGWALRGLGLILLVAMTSCGSSNEPSAEAPVLGAVERAGVEADANDAASPPFDIGSIIRQVHFAYRPEGASFAAAHSTYGVSVVDQATAERRQIVERHRSAAGEVEALIVGAGEASQRCKVRVVGLNSAANVSRQDCADQVMLEHNPAAANAGFGTARIVDDASEKAAELDRFVDRMYPGRRQTMRPNTAQELKATTLIGMEIDEVAAKISDGGPTDDEADYASEAWAGVIPIEQVIGAPREDPARRKDIPYPASLQDYAVGARLDAVIS